MRKLLRADLFCLRRSRVLWLCMAAAFVISAIFLLRLSTDNENMRTLDDAFLQLLPFCPSCTRPLSASSWESNIRTVPCATSWSWATHGARYTAPI